MLLRETQSGDLVDVVDMSALTNPFIDQVLVQYQHGEDLLEPEVLSKSQLRFPSGEGLPVCWSDGHYRDKQVFSRF
ncbi:acetyltransferase [Corallincola platygyrae]|uniref:Acetyltransferase n=1 Tax=Corallincola platygyrae TaxID=1193278 RepID=A0ABW4XQG8_9GAMM